jgi:hypothetical protein
MNSKKANGFEKMFVGFEKFLILKFTKFEEKIKFEISLGKLKKMWEFGKSA